MFAGGEAIITVRTVKYMSDVRWINFDLLQNFMVDVLIRLGVPERDASIVSEVLITSDKRGIDSHGIGRFKPIYVDRIDQGILNPVTNIDVVRDNMATAVIDANNGMGHVAGCRAMEMAIEKARAYGIGMTVVKNSSHYGFAGYYAMMASQQGMVGITGTNARPSIAPTFGVENMLGTNPLTVAIPTDEAFDFVLDCATSTSQRGKIEKYDRDGKKIPAGWVIGRDGKTRVDTHQILEDLNKGKAALTPLGGVGEENGGYKGYGYATVVEILSSAFAAGPFLKMLCGVDESGSRVPYRLGHFFIAVNVECFIDVNTFRHHVGEILRALRSSEKAEGAERIYTAGEKEYLQWLERKDKGAPVNDVLFEQLQGLKERFGLIEYRL